MTRIEIRRLPNDQILMQVDDRWHLVIPSHEAAHLGAMLLDAALPPDGVTTVNDTWTTHVEDNRS